MFGNIIHCGHDVFALVAFVQYQLRKLIIASLFLTFLCLFRLSNALFTACSSSPSPKGFNR